MRSFFKFAILYLFFYTIIFFSDQCESKPIVKIDENERILALASNGELLGVALPTRILFYSIISNTSETLLADLFSMEFDTKFSENDFEFNLLPDNTFLLCSIDTCRLYKLNLSEKSARVSLKISFGWAFKQWTSVVLDDKLLVSLLPVDTQNSVIVSYSLDDGHLIGRSSDHVSVLQSKILYGFKSGEYSYFLSTIREPDLYSKDARARPSNTTITRLTRICNNDNSRDLVSKMNIHLACGKDPNDYTKIPNFNFQSAFLTSNHEKLFVLFDASDIGQLTCSYSLTDINSYFDNVWDACQQISSREMFQDECLSNEKHMYCSYSWMRTSSYSNCEHFGSHNKRITNCEAANYNQTLNRFGWIENFYPIWGKSEVRYAGVKKLSGLDDKTFMTLSQDKILKRLAIDGVQGTPALWNKTVDKFSTVQSSQDHSPYIIYTANNQLNAQQISCKSLYPMCSVIRWEDPLKCSYCAFSNSTGYVTSLSANNNQSCIQSEGKIIVNQCPPTIQRINVDKTGLVTIFGDFLTNFNKNPRILICEDECVIKTTKANFIECQQDDAVEQCDVQILGDLIHTSDYIVTFNNRNSGQNTDDMGTTTEKSSSRKATKFIVGISAALFFIAVIVVIGYVIWTNRCGDSESRGGKPFISHTALTSEATMRGHPYNSVSTTADDFDPALYNITVFPDHEIEKVCKVGSGNFSTVYKYRYRSHPDKFVAVKEIFDGDMREVKLISQCEHENIVRYFGYFRNEGISLVMEYLGGGDLHKYLINMNNAFKCHEGFNMVLQIAEGMRYLAEKGIIHRDLAARNCMMSEDRSVIKISDFGLGRKFNMNETYAPIDNRVKLPYRWTAIECLWGEPFSEKSDVWSFGIVIWEIFSRAKIPYADSKSNQCILDLLAAGERLPHPGTGCPDELHNIMLSCWTENPTDRPTFAELYNEMEALIKDLEENGIYEPYYSLYLTPRASMNDGSVSSPTIMDNSDVNNFVRGKSFMENGHASSIS